MSATTAIPAGTYNIDPTHSNVGFEIKHMGIATVRGTFRKFTGQIVDGRLEGSVQVASVDTGEPNRDGHLQAPDMFDAAQFPEITFRSNEITSEGDTLKVGGEITLKGVTKPIELTGTVGEGGTDPWGKERIGFEVSGTVDRTDFGVSWNQELPNGKPLVSNDVKLIVSVSAVKA